MEGCRQRRKSRGRLVEREEQEVKEKIIRPGLAGIPLCSFLQDFCSAIVCMYGYVRFLRAFSKQPVWGIFKTLLQVGCRLLHDVGIHLKRQTT